MSIQVNHPIAASFNTPSTALSQSLSDTGCTKDIIDSFNEFYAQNAFNLQNIQTDLADCATSSIIQHLKAKYRWNPAELHTFYEQIQTVIKPDHQEMFKKQLSLSLAQSGSSQSISDFSFCDLIATSSVPTFIDENSISSSFPAIVSTQRKQKHIVVTAPCSPISECCSLNHYVTDDTFGNESEFQVLDMISSVQSAVSNVSESKTNYDKMDEVQEINIEHEMKQIILNVIAHIAQTDGQKCVHQHHHANTHVQKQNAECFIERVSNTDDDIWSDEDQSGFVYIDEDMEELECDVDVESEMKGIVLNIVDIIADCTFEAPVVVYESKEMDIASEMKHIILNIVHHIDNDIVADTYTLQEPVVYQHMKGVIVCIVEQIEKSTDVCVYAHPSDNDIESKMRNIVCNIMDTIEYYDQPRMDENKKNILVMDRPQYIKDEQIAEKEESVLIMDGTLETKDESITDMNRLSLSNQFHSKSGTMVVIECPESVLNVNPSEKRYSIVVSDIGGSRMDSNGLTQIQEEEQEEDHETQEEDEVVDDECTEMSEKEKKLFTNADENERLNLQNTTEPEKRRSSFFVHVQSEKNVRSLKELKLDQETKKEDEDEEEEVDPFAIYRQYPKDPKESIQFQRISYLLTQYQRSFNGRKITKDSLCKSQCVVRFISDGNIDAQNEDKYKYNEELLLNDWYYILVHYCDDDTLFARLYEDITCAIGEECDVLQCAFIKRNYKQFITNNDDPYYYGFTEHQQHTRIRFLDRIHCHLCHSYDLGFKLTPSERQYVDDEAGDKQQILDKKELHLKDKRFMRLKRKLFDKIKMLKQVIGPKRRCINKFVTQIHNDDGNKINITKHHYKPTLDLPEAAKKDHKHIKIPTKIEINDNYQFGQKFYYWKYHKQAGWKWYIHSRYKSFKQEMIRNTLLTVDEWNMYYNEAQFMSSTFLCKSYIPLIEKYFGNYFYGIRDGDTLRIDHILAVLLFTNDCNLQIKLNKSYRKRSEHESDAALKQRHSYYANWARLLCETVEIYTNNEFYNKVNDLYHGTNCSMYFNNIYASLYTPTSMTRSLEVATCFSNKNGLLLHFENGDTEPESNSTNCNRYFECNWMSVWSNECEVLFVGSAAPLKFKSVLQWQFSYNYFNYISAITILQNMLHGDPLTTESISQPIIEAIGDLIVHQLNKEKNKKLIHHQSIGQYSSSVKIADYIYEYFNHFVQNTTYHIQFDLYKMNYDYYEIQKMFFTKKGDWVKFEVLFKLFQNVRYLTIVPGWSADDCALKLTRQRVIGLFHILQKIDCDVERISIDEPNTSELSLKEVMADFKPMFKTIGWNIDCCGYKKYDDSIPRVIIVKTLSP